jgi:hypothetical protein
MSSVNYRNLLECLLAKGLKSSEALIEGFRCFFIDSYFTAMNGHKDDFQVAKAIAESLVDCLSSENYRVIEVAAKILRDYINCTEEIPANSVSALLDALTKTVPTSAIQVAFTLGCIGCTKPCLGLLPDSSLEHDIDMELCWKCSGGFMRTDSTANIVPNLVKGLFRSMSKDKSRKVRRACAIALGEIGYTRPELVSDALKPLRECLKEERGRDGVIFALGSIGYTRPELIEDLIEKIKACSQEGPIRDSWPCHNAMKKIGLDTGCLVNSCIVGKRSLNDTLDIFFSRMKKYEGGLVSQSIFAISELGNRFPQGTISCLNQKLAITQQKSEGTGWLSQNLVITMAKISESLPNEMKATVPLLVNIFIAGSISYRELECSAMALSNIFRAKPEFIPEGLVDVLTTFLQNEGRYSVVTNTKKLMEEVLSHL